MRCLLPALLLLALALVVESEDVVCGSGKTRKSVTLKKGTSVSFSTQAGAKYGKKATCAVMFKRPRKGKMSKCKLTFSCSSFELTAANSGCTKKSDFIMINKKKYCKSNSPSVTVTGTKLKVLFKSHRKSLGGAGATCTAACSSGTPPVTTGAPGGGGGSSDCKCGLAVRNQRIVGGVETEINEYPWQVGVVSKGSTFVWCGATVISDRWILTAAHCTKGKGPKKIQVLLGEHNYNTASETTSLRMDIAQKKEHESYNDRTTDYDFSLLKTTSAIDFSAYPNIRPACLPQAGSSESYTDWVATVTGWGTLSSSGSTSNKLREVDVKVVSYTACIMAYGGSITSRMLCAEAAGGNGGKDACQGDSGGPLISKAAGSDGVTAGQNYELIGVVSWGAGCAEKDYPGVYARVTNQLSWITTTTASNWQTCPRT